MGVFVSVSICIEEEVTTLIEVEANPDLYLGSVDGKSGKYLNPNKCKFTYHELWSNLNRLRRADNIGIPINGNTGIDPKHHEMYMDDAEFKKKRTAFLVMFWNRSQFHTN